jgi:hypothetical protein
VQKIIHFPYHTTFYEGAAVGLAVTGFNHLMHPREAPDQILGRSKNEYYFGVLTDEGGANGAGHQGIFAQQKNGKLHYISKDGTYENGGIYGKSHYSDVKDFASVAEINDYYFEFGSPGKKYDVVAFYKMTRSQIDNAVNTALGYAKQDYNLFTNNCSTMVDGALKAAYNPIIWSHTMLPNTNFYIQQMFFDNHLVKVRDIKK